MEASERVQRPGRCVVVASEVGKMTDTKIEETPAEQKGLERRAYEAPAVRDFFQPLVVLGTGAVPTPVACQATPKHPKF